MIDESYFIAKSRPAIPVEGTPASSISTVNVSPALAEAEPALIEMLSAAETEAIELNTVAVHAVAIKQAAALLNFIIKFLLSKIKSSFQTFKLSHTKNINIIQPSVNTIHVKFCITEKTRNTTNK
jgi:hypothetical protein